MEKIQDPLKVGDVVWWVYGCTTLYKWLKVKGQFLPPKLGLCVTGNLDSGLTTIYISMGRGIQPEVSVSRSHS